MRPFSRILTFVAVLSLCTAAWAIKPADTTTEDKKKEEKKSNAPARTVIDTGPGELEKEVPAAARVAMLNPLSAQRPRLPTRVDPKTGQEVIYITNDDLERMYGRVRPRAEATSIAGYDYVSPPAGAAAKAQAQAQQEQSPAETAARANEIRQEIARLRKNLTRLRNPLLGRPDMTQEETETQQGYDSVARVQWTEQRIAELQAELIGLGSR